MKNDCDLPYEKLQTVGLVNQPMVHPPVSRPVRHYFAFSLFSAICLCPATGLIALAYSLKSSAKADVNFHDKAGLYSRRALFWNMVSTFLAILSVILVVMVFNHLGRMIEEQYVGLHSQRFPYTASNADYYRNNDNINRIIGSI